MSRLRYLTFAISAVAATPGLAQSTPDAAPAPMPILAPASSFDVPVEAYYATHNQAAIWFRDAGTREAAAKLPAILRRAPLDGLSDGPDLAAKVEAALVSGQPADDKLLSSAWVRYVQALRAPIDGMAYGDPELAPGKATARDILDDASSAASLASHLDKISSVNPLYSALRDQAVQEGAQDDPRVRGSLDRMRLLPAKGRAILVDVASAELWMLDDGQSLGSMKVIVGKTTSPTPLLAGTIHYVTFNPYWHILEDVARRKVAPAVLKQGTSYLKAARYELTSDWSTSSEPVDPDSVDWKAVAAGTQEVFIRQLPGRQNMMGAVKFSFQNKDDIFLHDTPNKGLFAKDKRTLSLGCVRLEQADRLAQWLLGRDAAPPSDAPELHVQLDKGVPVYLTYLTANVVDGKLAYSNDVYSLDRPSEQQLLASAPDSTSR